MKFVEEIARKLSKTEFKPRPDVKANGNMKKIRKMTQEIANRERDKVEIATLKVKAAMWGALAAAVAGPIVAIIANILIKG